MALNKPLNLSEEIKNTTILAGVVQWVEHQPANSKAASSISSQGTCQGCRPDPHVGICERQLINESLTHQRVPPSLSPFLPPL